MKHPFPRPGAAGPQPGPKGSASLPPTQTPRPIVQVRRGRTFQPGGLPGGRAGLAAQLHAGTEPEKQTAAAGRMAKRPRRRGRRTAAGRLLLGQFTEAAPEPGEPHRPLADIYAETLAGFRGPVLADVACGQVTLPEAAVS